MSTRTIRSVVCFGAHPDDETMLIGGVLAMLATRGIRVHVVSATRGEGGEIDPASGATRETLAEVREAELRCAARALGAASVDVLGYVDPLIGEDEALYPFEADFDALTKQIADLCRRYEADVALSHGADGEYGHPAHQLMHQAVQRAVRALPGRTLFYTFAAAVPGIEDHIWNANEPAHLALDVRPWLDIKERAALCHRTQHALFKRRRNLKTVREALRTVESVRRHWPPLAEGEPPDDAFAAVLRAVGAWEPAQARRP